MAEYPINPKHNVFKKYRKVNYINPYVFGVSYDPDAQAFLTATGITDVTQKDAINQLVLDFKTYSIWSKMRAIYPIVGGTAFTHKWNLKNPLDTDAAFRLVYYPGGTITHSSNGMVSNGLNGWIDTKFIPSSHLTTNNGGWSFYCRTNVSENKYEMGTANGTGFNALLTRFTNKFYAAYDTTYANTYANTDSRGFYTVSRNATNNIRGFRNGTKVIDNTSTGYLSTFSMYLLAENNAGLFGNISTKECAFSALHDGLSDTEAANFYTAVQAFQTTLGRQV
jgi:hypothetical protein